MISIIKRNVIFCFQSSRLCKLFRICFDFISGVTFVYIVIIEYELIIPVGKKNVEKFVGYSIKKERFEEK